MATNGGERSKRRLAMNPQEALEVEDCYNDVNKKRNADLE
jgi:hypothetical protein